MLDFRVLAAFAFSLVAPCSMVSDSVRAGEEETPADTVQTAARVNQSVISEARVQEELKRAKQQIMQKGQPVPEDQASRLRMLVLDRLISQELLYQASQQEKVNVAKQEVDEEFNQLKSRFPDARQFELALAMMNLNPQTLRDRLERGMAIRKFVEEHVTKDITVSDEESKAFYEEHQEDFRHPEQVRASHILVKAAPDAPEAQKTKAHEEIQQARERLKDEAFADVAADVSDCPSSEKGGDLGYFQEGQMVKPFSETAFALEKGAVSDIVTTKFGYHLIKVTDKRAAGLSPYPDVKEDIQGHLKNSRSGEAVEARVKALREKADIEIVPNAEPELLDLKKLDKPQPAPDTERTGEAPAE